MHIRPSPAPFPNTIQNHHRTVYFCQLVRDLFKAADAHAPSIVFIDEIDAVGSKRYNANSGGEREIQRTMLELLNQLDGFDDRGDIKVSVRKRVEEVGECG